MTREAGAFEIVDVTPAHVAAASYKIALPRGPRDAHEDNIVATGAGAHVLDVLLKLTQGSGTVLDIGANLGTIALPLAISGCRVLAFDILESNIKALELGASANNISRRIDTYRIAAWSCRSRLAIYNSGSLGLISTVPQSSFADAAPLDRIVPWYRPIKAVKIDIEGTELHALQGMRRLLKLWHPHIVFENYPAGLSSFNSSTAKVFSFLRSLGYKIFRLRWQVLHPASDVPEQLVTDFLASTWPEDKLRSTLGYEIRPMLDGEIVAEILAYSEFHDDHRLYLLSIADLLPESVRNDTQVQSLIASFSPRLKSDPRIAKYRAGVIAP